MLAGSTTASSTISTHTSPVLSDSPVRPGRRRGLSYLRNHLHHTTPTAPTDETTTASHQSQFQVNGADPFSPPSNEHSRNPLRQLEALRLLPWPSTTASIDNTHSEQNRSMARHRSITSPIASSAAPAHQASRWLGLDFGLSLQASESALPPLPAGSGVQIAHSNLPSIQFIPATELNRSRPSLDFRRVTRILPSMDSIIRVGRYSEKENAADANSHTPSDAPIGFKSKVVSRRHCEFSYSDNQWYIKDVKSSSGTFLNHIRLSQPGQESRPFPVNDGDVVQLGIDFKGGEEMIFRCVKIRIETNRGWQKGLNKFNKSTHKQLQQLAKGRKKDSDAASKHSTECTICLNSIAPCQALFVAPCSHTWHFKCIRTILDESRSGQFLCPNCRAQADLDADVEEEELEDFEVYDSQEEDGEQSDAQDETSPFSESLPSPPVQPIPSLRQRDNSTIQPSSRSQPTNRTQSDTGLGLHLTNPTNHTRDDSEDATSPSLRANDSPTPPAYLNPDDLSWTLSSLSMRQQNTAHLASLDDTITSTNPRNPSTAHPHSARLAPTIPALAPAPTSDTSSSHLDPSASTFVPTISNTATTTTLFPRVPSAPLSAPLPIRASAYSPRLQYSLTPATETSNNPFRTRSNNATPRRESTATSPHLGDGLGREGPMTPRNDAGPFVFDGSGESGARTRAREPILEGS